VTPPEYLSLTPKPAYLFLSRLTPTELDSITQANNRTYRFLSHGIETRKAYRRVCRSYDSLKARFDSLFRNIDSLTEAEFAEIQTTDSVLADYILDRENGSPEEMLTWSSLLCEVYPHVSRRVVISKPFDFEEVTVMRHKYFNTDTLTFKQIYFDILKRMVELNNIEKFD